MGDHDERGGNLADRLALLARERGWLDRTACVTGGVPYRFAEVYEGAENTAAVLAARGIGEGSRLLIAVPDGIDMVRTFLGALRLGAIAIPVNTELHPDELHRMIDLAEPEAVVGAPGLAVPSGSRVITPDDIRSGFGRHPVPPVAVCGPDTPGFALFTSGTTGGPRLCFHSHGDPLIHDEAFARPVLGLTTRDVSYSVSRMYFAYGLGNSLFYPLLSGGTSVLTATRPSPEAAMTLVRDSGVTVFYAQPSFYARLLSHPDHTELARLRVAVCAGEVLSGALERKLRELLGNRLLNSLGTTEVGQAFTSNSLSQAREGTVGRVLPPYRVRIVDGHGETVPPSAEGRLEVAGPTIAPGVARGGDRPLHGGDGWWATGDAATMDDDGFIRVLGRVDDVEIVGGQNVHPTDTENVLMEHPSVVDAAVCSVRDGHGPTRLRAHVILRDDRIEHTTIRGELRAAAQGRLTWYKVPEEFVFVTELPRTPTGKLNRRALREMAVGNGHHLPETVGGQ